MISFRLGRPSIDLSHPKIQRRVVFLLWLFLLVFPKGGFKLSNVPITWGYLLLGLITIFSIFRSSFTFYRTRLQAFALFLPFQLTILLTAALYGIGHLGFAFSFILSFIFIPCAFFLLLSEDIETMKMDYLYRLIKNGMFLIAAYGIFLFIYKFTTYKLIEIPFLTTNYHDVDIANKCNNRGIFTKLISTYNNGNIYGACILMFLPFYCLLENKKWKFLIIYLSLVLTLSRTVWAGVIFNELIFRFLVSKKTPLMFFKFLGVLMVIFIIASCYLISTPNLFHNQSLLSMAGRDYQFREFYEIALFKDLPLQGISEIVYLGIISHFGIVGLIAYLICISGPTLMSLSVTPMTPVRKSIICGLLNYLFISFSDGALLFIPTMAFFWFLSSLVLKKDLGPIANIDTS